MDPVVTKTISIAFGILLLVAARHKLRGLDAFRAVLLDYRLLPPVLVPFAAWAIAGAEMLIGSLWFVCGVVPTMIAASLTALLLATYALAVAINLLRGRVHISCGCGLSTSAPGSEQLSWGLVLRNGLLVAVAVVAAFPALVRELQWLDYVTLLAALSATTLLYVASAQLLGNAAAIGTWRNSRD
jgi:hypothetical protein